MRCCQRRPHTFGYTVRLRRMAENSRRWTRRGPQKAHLRHELAECKARKKFCPRPGDDYAEKFGRSTPIRRMPPEMESCTDLYVQAIDEECMRYSSRPLVVLETRVNYCGTVPEGFGTADCIIIGGDTLTIIDYKHGKGVPISAMDNPQLKLYAIGALNQFNAFYGDAIKHIRLRIVQPRVSDELNDFELTVQDLMQWGNSVVAPWPIWLTTAAGNATVATGAAFARREPSAAKRRIII